MTSTTSPKLARIALGTLAAGALAFTSATPALADDRRDRGGPSAGEIIAGVAVIGGIAALAGAFNGDRGRNDWRESNRRGGSGWQRNRGFAGGGRDVVDRCARTAEIDARRFGGWRFAQVTRIRDVDRTRQGFRVRGNIDVQGAPGFRNRNADRGRFTCFLDGRGRPIVEFNGIRGLR